jgi:hypothetical protein
MMEDEFKKEELKDILLESCEAQVSQNNFYGFKTPEEALDFIDSLIPNYGMLKQQRIIYFQHSIVKLTLMGIKPPKIMYDLAYLDYEDYK